MPLLDIHSHFPMHTRFPPRCVQGTPRLGKELEFWAANCLLNFQAGKPRVSLDELLSGASGGIGSVLYDPDDEFFRDSSPLPSAFKNLIAQMDNVEAEVADRVKVVRNPEDLGRCLERAERFIFHCVEGAFALGGDIDNISVLAKRGVAYVVIAHLFYRGVATCENAIPFVPDAVFKTVLNSGQPQGVGLTDLGRSMVSRLLAEGILVDITHSTRMAQNEIFELAREYNNAPVISSHTGVRASSDYPLNLGQEAVRQIAASKGLIGIILASHWLRNPDQQFLGPDGFELLFRAIDCINAWTGSYDTIAIGSDLDGFIKPIHGCESYSKTPALIEALQYRYPMAANKILYANALEVLERGWKGAR